MAKRKAPLRVICPRCGEAMDPVARPYHPSHDIPGDEFFRSPGLKVVR